MTSTVTRLGLYSDELPSRAEDYAAVIAARGRFQAAKSLSGRPCAGFPAATCAGSLPHVHRCRLAGDDPDYVILSYDTPIAWHADGTWRVPNVRYSLTTTQHQWLIGDAIRLLPEVIGGTAALDAPRGWYNGESARKGRGKSPYGPRTGGW